MAILTDPARELYEIAEKVRVGTSSNGAAHIAKLLEVEPWSAEFMRIITHVLDRANLVARVLEQSASFDDQLRAEALGDLNNFKTAFSSPILTQTWHDSNGGLGILNTYSPRIRYLSSEVRRAIQYPKLTDDEVQELVQLIDQYLASLANDPEVPAFARDAVTAGLQDFVLRLTKLKWAGAAYALAAFRELVWMYDELAQSTANTAQLEASAWFTGFRQVLSNFKTKIDAVKSVTDAIVYVHTGYSIFAPVSSTCPRCQHCLARLRRDRVEPFP